MYIPQSNIHHINTQIHELYEKILRRQFENQASELMKNDLTELTEEAEEELQTMAMSNIKTFLEYDLENDMFNLQSNIEIILELNKKKVDRLEKKIILLEKKDTQK